MTNELEKQFFDTFGIKPKEFKSCDVGTFCPYPEKECGTDTCPYYRTYKVDYPAIGDRILLELICILTRNDEYGYFGRFENIKDMKDFTLREFIADKRYFKHQVRTLFEEG